MSSRAGFEMFFMVGDVPVNRDSICSRTVRNFIASAKKRGFYPISTVKKGKTYRYYSPIRHRRFGAWASQHGPLPAAPIEELVTQQIVAALSAPHIVQSVWDRMQQTIRPDLTEPQVVLPMRNLASLWRELFPAEQCRLAQLLIERVVIADGGLEIIWRDQGWQQLLDDGVVGSGSEIAQREGLHHSTVNELLRLTLLEPAIIQAILAGQQPRCMSLLWLAQFAAYRLGGAAGGGNGV